MLNYIGSVRICKNIFKLEILRHSKMYYVYIVDIDLCHYILVCLGFQSMHSFLKSNYI